MSAAVKRAGFRRSCSCGWSSTYTTAGRADYGKRRHSCSRWLAKTAAAERGRSREAAIDRTPKPCCHKQVTHVHGTRACYVLDRCRCLPCSASNVQAERDRSRQKAYGRYNKYVDADPVRAHLRELQAAGMGMKRMIELGHTNSGQLWKLLYGKKRTLADGSVVQQPSRRVTRAVGERLLAIQLDIADGQRVPAHGTVLRMRALVALGWSQSQLARRLDIQRGNFRLTGTWQIQAGTARRAAALYDELSMTLPPSATRHERAAATRARNTAATFGWLPPLALDDDRLDDPGYEPWFEQLDPETEVRAS